MPAPPPSDAGGGSREVEGEDRRCYGRRKPSLKGVKEDGMPKRIGLTRKKLAFAAADSGPQVVIVTGRKRDSINPGLSPETVSKIERYEAASQRAEQRLGTIRLR